MATRPKTDPLSKRVAAIEKQLSELANQLADHTASLPPFLLVGWNEISAYCQRSPRTISRYAKNLGFPAYRCGRHVCTSPYAIDDWLIAFQRAKAKAKQDGVSALSDGELKARLGELNATLKR
jgi:DNA-binding MurR/RpiR family transcriptional regulator